MASPLEVVHATESEQLDAEYFQTLAKEERLVRWVVGLPLHLSGDESQKSREASVEFGQWLGEAHGLARRLLR